MCEVLNRLDRRTYAIKKVRLTGGASRRDARRQLREVEALAAAFHPHVVRYYQAWIEGLEDAPIQEEFSLLDGFSDEDDDSDSDNTINNSHNNKRSGRSVSKHRLKVWAKPYSPILL